MNINPDFHQLQVRFEYPDFTPMAVGGFDWTIRSLSWSLPGGSDTAVLNLDDALDREGIAQTPLSALVGSPLSILSAAGGVMWNGWVETVSRIQGGVCSSCSTRGMANRVIARLPDLSDAADSLFARWRTSDWLEEPASSERFGRKEHLVALPYMNSQAVSQMLTAALSGDNVWPAMQVTTAEKEQVEGLHITARGWWQRLDWVLDGQHNAGREMHLEGGKTHLEIGKSSSQSKLAQSWKTDESGFALGQVWLRAAMVGDPLDNLLVNLCTDNNGSPGTMLAQCDGGTVSIHGGWQWLCWTFAEPVVISPGTLSWLVIERSGSPDETNHYVVQSDDGRGYSKGSLKRWNGSAWVGINHDLRFCCLAVSQSSDLISEMLQRPEVAPFLRGVQVRQQSGLQVVRWREIGNTLLDTLRDLLARGGDGGNEFSMLINAQRFTEVFELPRSPFAPLSIRPDGTLCEANGETVRWEAPLLGREVLVTLPSGQYSLLVKRLRWTPAEGLRMVEVRSNR